MFKLNDNPTDPIFIDTENDKYYFADELWSSLIGPYDTEKACREAMNLYADNL